MKRRNFVTTALAGLAALPFLGKTAAKGDEPEPKQPMTTPTTKKDVDCTCLLVHRESYSSNRATDARIISGCVKHGR